MDEANICSNSGILTRNQKKMLNEKNTDKQTASSDKKKIKIKEKTSNHKETNMQTKDTSNNKEKLRSSSPCSSVSEFEFSSEDEVSSQYYSTEDEEELKRFEEEMLAMMDEVDKEEEEEKELKKQGKSYSKTVTEKGGIQIEIVEATSEEEQNKDNSGEESAWETEEEEEIVDENTHKRRNAPVNAIKSDKKNKKIDSNLIKTIRDLGKNYQVQPTYELIIDDSAEQERIFRKRQKKAKNKFLQSISEERRKYIEDCEKQLKERSKLEFPPYYQILELDIPIRSKEIILKYMSSLENLDETSSEYHKFESFVDTCKEVPFGKYITLPKPDNFSNFLMKSVKTLDNCIYGHELPKLEILQYLSQLISNPTCKGQPLGIYGPPGIGKTTLIQEGLAKVLNRPFYFISLGGCSDASFLDGHSFTYEGSRTGKIVDILRSAQCMNPIIYFDELDKISDTSKGEEISNLLVHLTDESQNSHFHDKYLHDIDLDLSKAFFVFSFNDIKKINPILRDRINILYLNDFKKEEKVKIATNYLIPKIKKEFNMTNEEDSYNISYEMIDYIIEKHIQKGESGVRTLKKLIKSIYSKINMLLLSDGSDTILEFLKMKRSLYETLIQNKTLNNREIIDFLLKSNKNMGIDSYIRQAMYT